MNLGYNKKMVEKMGCRVGIRQVEGALVPKAAKASPRTSAAAAVQ
jgi:hypothetical protein